jgi:type III pantothenate kinase
MTERVLTIDLGNSRCKLVLWEHTAGAPPSAIDERDLPTAQILVQNQFTTLLARWLPPSSDIACAGLSSVAAPAVEDDIVQTLRARFGERFVPDVDSGLANECTEPARVGRDRLFAARGAFELVRSAAVVVDAGTAVTVDALATGPSGGPAGPRFLGGAIAPGPRLLADALARHAARLPLVEPAVGAHALGRDTAGALQAGIVVGLRGAAAELAREVARESGLESAPIVVTGGARAFLLQPTPCFTARVVEDRLLVHRGLVAALSGTR